MLNQSINTFLTAHGVLDKLNPETLKSIRNEGEIICESIEYGLMHLGEMMFTLGNLADEEQDFTNKAMSNDSVKHIGNLIKANAYLLNTMRETAGLAEYYLNEKGGK